MTTVPMKILNVIATLNPEWGGPMEAVRQLTRAMTDAGHHGEVACLDAPGSPWLEGLPFAVHPMGPSTGRFRYNPRLIPWLRSYAKGFDAVIVHGTWQFQSIGSWIALRNSDVPYFIYPHGALESWSLDRYPLKGLKKRVYWQLAERRVLRDARAAFFTCEEELAMAGNAFRPFECKPVVVKFGTAGPDPSEDPQRHRQAFFQRFPELKGRRLLLFLGRIHPQKGCDMLIEALAAVAETEPTLQLVMAGPDLDGFVADLKVLAEAKGVADRVTWTGMLTGDVKWGAFRAAEAFCLPSFYDSFGISAVEALACGTPVLLSNRVGIWREVVEDQAGLAEPPTVEGTTTCLRRWLALSEGERVSIGTQARSTFEERFHIQAVAESTIRALQANIVKPRAVVATGT